MHNNPRENGAESLIVAIIRSNRVVIQSWNARDMVLISQSTGDIPEKERSSAVELAETIDTAIADMTPKPSSRTPLFMLINQPVRNERPTGNTLYGTNSSELDDIISTHLNRPVTILNTDDMMALAVWEKTGYQLKDNPAEQLKWARHSRVLAVGLHHGFIGIGMVNNGTLIDGLGVEQESFPWHNIQAQYAPVDVNADDIETGYYINLLNITVNKYLKPNYAPDSIVMTIDHQELHGTLGDEGMIYHDHEHNEEWYAGYGAMMYWRKEQIGWRPMFLDEAIREDDQNNTLEYVFTDNPTDESDEEDIINRVNAKMTENDDTLTFTNDSEDECQVRIV